MAIASIQLDTSAADTYCGFIDALNRHDLETAARLVDRERYRETCLGFTPGLVGWQAAVDSMLRVWKGLPDLHVDLHHVLAADAVALAQGTVRGAATGRLYGAPATGRTFQANFFDHVRLERGLIIERIQQTDVIGQMRQLYGKGLGVLGLGALLWRS